METQKALARTLSDGSESSVNPSKKMTIDAATWILTVIATTTTRRDQQPTSILLTSALVKRLENNNALTREERNCMKQKKFIISPIESIYEETPDKKTLWSLMITETNPDNPRATRILSHRLYSILGSIGERKLIDQSRKIAMSIEQLFAPEKVFSASVKLIECYKENLNIESSAAWLPEFLLFDLKEHLSIHKPWYEKNFMPEREDPSDFDNEYINDRRKEVWMPFVKLSNRKRMQERQQIFDTGDGKSSLVKMSSMKYSLNKIAAITVIFNKDDKANMLQERPETHMTKLTAHVIMIAIMMKFTRYATLKNAKEVAGLVISPELVNYLLYQYPNDTDNYPSIYAQETYFCHLDYNQVFASIIITRDKNIPLTLIGVENLWTLVMSRRNPDGGMNHIFYNPGGTIPVDESLQKAKEYVKRLEIFLGIGQSSKAEGRFREANCVQWNTNKHTPIYILECMRYCLSDNFVNKQPWHKHNPASSVAEDEVTPAGFTEGFIKARRSQVWSHYSKRIFKKYKKGETKDAQICIRHKLLNKSLARKSAKTAGIDS